MRTFKHKHDKQPDREHQVRPNPERMGAFHEEALSLEDAKVAQDKSERNAFDLTFTAPMSFSVVFALNQAECDE